jgi:hypothetical protein
MPLSYKRINEKKYTKQQSERYTDGLQWVTMSHEYATIQCYLTTESYVQVYNQMKE